MLPAHHVIPTLRAGIDPARPWRETRLLHVGAAGGVHTHPTVRDAHVDELQSLLQPGDLLVLNDAATLPASFEARLGGRRVEVRLAAARAEGSFPFTWTVVLFGDGDWRTPTENRPAPPRASVGDGIDFGAFEGIIRARHTVSHRLVDVELDRDGPALARAMYSVGAPIQYSYHRERLRLADVQTPYAARPWAMEMPSTGRPLHWPLLDRLRRRGVQLAWLTHAAGLSSTGDARLDAALPLAERYAIPAETMRRVHETHQRGGRVVAVGTTVVRALEAAASSDVLEGATDIRLGCPNDHCNLSTVDGILTGIHSPGESHYDLLGAFADHQTLERAHTHAAQSAYLAHEFGDLMLLWRTKRRAEKS